MPANLYRLTIDVPLLSLSRDVNKVFIRNLYVDVDDTHIITAPLDYSATIVAGLDTVVVLPATTFGSVYQLQLYGDDGMVLSAFFGMPDADSLLSDLDMHTAYPPRVFYPNAKINWGRIAGNINDQTDLTEIMFTKVEAEELSTELDNLIAWGNVKGSILDQEDLNEVMFTKTEAQQLEEELLSVGITGDDAYEVAVKDGFVGTRSEWLASLNGLKGDPFTYDDFTPEQLAGLKGDKGDPGDDADNTLFREELNAQKLDTGISTTPIAEWPVRTQANVNSEKISFLTAGAAGGGVVDDTNAIVRAISNANVTEIDGLNKEYKITSALAFNRGNLEIKNATFLVTGLLQNQFAMQFKGTQASSVNLASDANSLDFTVADISGFAVNDFVYIESNKEWSSAPYPVVKCGEIAQIKSIEGNKINLKGSLCSYYKVADGARASKLNLLSGAVFKNVRFKNLDPNALAEGGLKLELCLSSYVDVKTENFQYAHVSVVRSAYTAVDRSKMSGSKALVGTNYGVVAVDGCYVLNVQNSLGDDLRHFVSTGNTSAGGISRFIAVEDSHVTNMHDAYFDSHVGCAEFFVNNCTGSSSNFSGGQDGIMAQNAFCKATNNSFNGVGRHGIAYIPMVNAGVSRIPLKLITKNNELNAIVSSGTSRDAVLVLTSEYTGRESIALVSTDGDKSSNFDYHNFIHAKKSGIDKVVIKGPETITPTIVRPIEIRAQESAINNVNINGGLVDSLGVSDLIYLRGYSSDFTIKNWQVGGITVVGNGSSQAGVGAVYTGVGYDNGMQVIGCIKNFNIDATNKSFVSQTNIIGYAEWTGGTVNTGTSLGFNVNVPDAQFGDLTKSSMNVPAQGVDVVTRIETAGLVRVSLVNNSGSNRTFGALRLKIALNKNV